MEGEFINQVANRGVRFVPSPRFHHHSLRLELSLIVKNVIGSNNKHRKKSMHILFIHV